MKPPKKRTPKGLMKRKKKTARAVMRDLFPKEAVDYADAQLRDAESPTKPKD
jgi:hypothetical protein